MQWDMFAKTFRRFCASKTVVKKSNNMHAKVMKES